MMSLIELRNVSKYWGDVRAVEKLNINIEEGEFVVLLGPSGCGKSTTLRLIAGLESVSAGGIFIDGKNVNNIDPSSRNISMVFQSYALFPHLNVEENIIFGLKVRKVKKVDRQVKLKNVAEKVGLSNLLKRKPAELSGGQRQRVALARAIISDNPVCLMDEPLSNLDAKLRHQMRSEIRLLQKDLNITLIYVTHDQTEAMSMADKIVLMNEGEIVQKGRPKELYEKPENTFTAKFLGNPPMNLINLEVESGRKYIPIFEDVNEIFSSIKELFSEFEAKGINEIWCISVNDQFVSKVGRDSQSVKDDFLFVADGNAKITESLGMILDCSGFGMGNRSNRYVMLLEDKVVKKLIIEENPGVCDLTNANEILKLL